MYFIQLRDILGFIGETPVFFKTKFYSEYENSVFKNYKLIANITESHWEVAPFCAF